MLAIYGTVGTVHVGGSATDDQRPQLGPQSAATSTSRPLARTLRPSLYDCHVLRPIWLPPIFPFAPILVRVSPRRPPILQLAYLHHELCIYPSSPRRPRSYTPAGPPDTRRAPRAASCSASAHLYTPRTTCRRVWARRAPPRKRNDRPASPRARSPLPSPTISAFERRRD